MDGNNLRTYLTKHGFKVGTIYKEKSGFIVEVDNSKTVSKLWDSLMASKNIKVKFIPISRNFLERIKRWVLGIR